MTDILTTEDYELCSKLKAMRFSGMAEAVMSHSRKESKFSEVNLHRTALVQLYSLLQQVSSGIVIFRQVIYPNSSSNIF